LHFQDSRIIFQHSTTIMFQKPAKACFTALPMTQEEAQQRGWDGIDVLIITGDAYVDHPSFGAAMIGRVLEHEGYRVGIIAQPDWKDVDRSRAWGLRACLSE
jgi:hypothetical protein